MPLICTKMDETSFLLVVRLLADDPFQSTTHQSEIVRTSVVIAMPLYALLGKTKQQMCDLPLKEFNATLKQSGFTLVQKGLVRKDRRQLKNLVAAQIHRGGVAAERAALLADVAQLNGQVQGLLADTATISAERDAYVWLLVNRAQPIIRSWGQDPTRVWLSVQNGQAHLVDHPPDVVALLQLQQQQQQQQAGPNVP